MPHPAHVRSLPDVRPQSSVSRVCVGSRAPSIHPWLSGSLALPGFAAVLARGELLLCGPP
eukprot:12920607-Prorocentrum_lima.AAC.1